MSQALYRKYRSKKLAEIVGQEHITDVLAQALAKQRIGHAFLFTGPRGTGKTSIARILAHEINSLQYTEETHHLDIIEIDAASNRRIDDIRDLRDKVHIAPASAQYKVYIIDEAHMLTSESFNALLKTLEEPPAHVIFMLATTEVHKLPATIVSRTQRFHFRPVAQLKVIAHLRFIAQSEDIAIDEDALALIAQHGEGSFRDSISLLDQLGSLTGDAPITAQLVETTLGLAPLAQVQSLVTAVIARQQETVIKALDELEQLGVSPVVLASQIVVALRQAGGDNYTLIDQLLEVPKSYHPQIKLLTILATYARSEQPRTVATSAAPAPVVSAPAPLTPLSKPKSASATVKKHTAPLKPSVKEQPAPVSIQADGDAPDTIDWQAILDFVRAKNVPLYSVLTHGKAEYAAGVLALYFTRELHKKKLEDAKYSSLFSGYLKEKYGAAPQITLQLGAPAPKDETAASVAVIMGGGEEVDVEAK